MYFFHWFDGAILVRISILTSTNKSLSRAKWRNHILITLKAKWMAQVEPSVTLERYFEEPKTNCHQKNEKHSNLWKGTRMLILKRNSPVNDSSTRPVDLKRPHSPQTLLIYSFHGPIFRGRDEIFSWLTSVVRTPILYLQGKHLYAFLLSS